VASSRCRDRDRVRPSGRGEGQLRYNRWALMTRRRGITLSTWMAVSRGERYYEIAFNKNRGPDNEQGVDADAPAAICAELIANRCSFGLKVCKAGLPYHR
jgi:hypothetical protein